jgi:hypothetical protein
LEHTIRLCKFIDSFSSIYIYTHLLKFNFYEKKENKEAMMVLLELQRLVQEPPDSVLLLSESIQGETITLSLNGTFFHQIYLLTYLLSGVLHKSNESVKALTFFSEGYKMNESKLTFYFYLKKI